MTISIGKLKNKPKMRLLFLIAREIYEVEIGDGSTTGRCAVRLRTDLKKSGKIIIQTTILLMTYALVPVAIRSEVVFVMREIEFNGGRTFE